MSYFKHDAPPSTAPLTLKDHRREVRKMLPGCNVHGFRNVNFQPNKIGNRDIDTSSYAVQSDLGRWITDPCRTVAEAWKAAYDKLKPFVEAGATPEMLVERIRQEIEDEKAAHAREAIRLAETTNPNPSESQDHESGNP